jgi:5-methylcytosine-specific restriction endonuclease McrA
MINHTYLTTGYTYGSKKYGRLRRYRKGNTKVHTSVEYIPGFEVRFPKHIVFAGMIETHSIRDFYKENHDILYVNRKKVLLSDNRLIFALGEECACCGTKVSHYALLGNTKIVRTGRSKKYVENGEWFLRPMTAEKNHMTVDHIIPQSQDGSNELHNLQLTCRRCNKLKGKKYVSVDLETRMWVYHEE